MKQRIYKTTTIDRFEAKFIPEPNSGCWLWMGAQCNPEYGYGQFNMNGRHETAHRASWMLYRGPIPPLMEIDHKCRNPHCVNPEHLQVSTQANNRASRELIRSVCRQGHPLEGENVETWGEIRRCKACRAASRTAYRERVRR